MDKEGREEKEDKRQKRLGSHHADHARKSNWTMCYVPCVYAIVLPKVFFYFPDLM